MASTACFVSGHCKNISSLSGQGILKGGSITVPLTSCLTGLDLSVLQIKTKTVSCHTADSKPVKQEVSGTMILPPLVFPGVGISIHATCLPRRPTSLVLCPLPANNFNQEQDRSYQKSLNRFLRVCYVPATSAVLIAFLSSFFAVAINSTNEANKAAGTHH
jgi:hypothetical protein